MLLDIQVNLGDAPMLPEECLLTSLSGNSLPGLTGSRRWTSTLPNLMLFVAFSTCVVHSALTRLSNGQVKIWNYETQTDIKTFEVTDVPVRCVKYIARKNWVGSCCPPMVLV